MRSIVFIYLLFSSFAMSQEVRFFKEDITFQIVRKSFVVDGYYWFSNSSTTNVEKLIFYPFGAVDTNETVDSVEVFNMTKGSTQNISNKTNAGFYFILNLEHGDTNIVRIQYRQKIISDSVQYILRSTLLWKRPLELAEYKLRIERQMKINRFSIVPDTMYTVQNENIYYWKRNNFMPQTDLVFYLRVF